MSAVSSESILVGLDVSEQPYQAFARLWHACGDHSVRQEGLKRDSCEGFASEFLEALKDGGPLPAVPPVSALKAIDEYLGVLEQAAYHVRTVDVNGARYHVVRRPVDWWSRYEQDRPNSLEYWTKLHHCVPTKHRGICIKILRQGEFTGLRLPLVAVVGGFADRAKPRWDKPPPPYRCTTLTDATTRCASVLQLLEVARQKRATIVVMPELTVDEQVLAEIQKWLQEKEHDLSLVVAGSFHVMEGAVRLGVSWLLGPRGHVIFSQHKLQPFRHSRKRGDEDIEAGTRLHVVQTGLGLLTIAICLDFCEKPSQPVGTLWAAVAPALVLVPSMGGKSTNRAHLAKAKDLFEEQGTRVLVASQRPDGRAALGIGTVPGPTGRFDHMEASPQLVFTLS